MADSPSQSQPEAASHSQQNAREPNATGQQTDAFVTAAQPLKRSRRAELEEEQHAQAMEDDDEYVAVLHDLLLSECC